jgi:hypothetical protein
MIDNPQPAWLMLLLLAFPGIVLAAYAINSIIFAPQERSLSTIPAVVLVLALLPTHFISLATESLSIGVGIAWSTIGISGYAWIARHWNNFHFTLGHEQIRKLAIAILSLFPIVAPTILLNVHDEEIFNGHHAIIAHLQNGVYPPRYLYDPVLPLRYHYGFDLAATIITGLLRVRPDHAIDILTLVLWPSMFLLFWRLGEYFGGTRAGLFVALAICYAGGWPLLCAGYYQLADSPQWLMIATQLTGYCTVGGHVIDPPFISSYFQHPWSIGLLLFSFIVLQRSSIIRLADPRPSLAMLACSLTLLSLCQAVLFVSMVAALTASEMWRLSRSYAQTSTRVLVVLGISLIGAKLAGGFFVS